MSDQSMISRREALIAATAIGVVAGIADAGDKSPGDNERRAAPLKLEVTLSDGQVVTLSAAELTIDFGGNGQLLVKPSGIMPVSKVRHDSGKNGQNLKQVSPEEQDPFSKR